MRTIIKGCAAGALALVMAASATLAHAQAEPRFGTRSVRACGPAVKSQPNPAQIKELVQCKFENKSNDYITLLDIKSVEAGKTRAYSQFLDSYATGIDTDAKVLPIRGVQTSYQCGALSKLQPYRGTYYVDNTGKNCLVVHQNKAEGKCYKTTFGDWWCGMHELVPPSDFLNDQPPPR